MIQQQKNMRRVQTFLILCEISKINSKMFYKKAVIFRDIPEEKGGRNFIIFSLNFDFCLLTLEKEPPIVKIFFLALFALHTMAFTIWDDGE
jgi:hypothetical protein